MKEQLNRIPASSPPSLDAYREPAALFKIAGRIIGHPAVRQRPDGLALFQRFCSNAFERIECDNSRITAIDFRPRYRELFGVALVSSDRSGAVERTRTSTLAMRTWS